MSNAIHVLACGTVPVARRALPLLCLVLALGSARAEDAPMLFRHDWHVIGPFANAGGSGLQAEYAPEKGVDLAAACEGLGGKPVRWQPVTGPGATVEAPGPVRLLNRFGANEDVCAYAYTVLHSESRRRVTLLVGADDAFVLWVNGRKVLTKSEYSAARPDDCRVAVELQPGDNPVLLKVCQGWGNWEFYFRVAAPPADVAAQCHVLENAHARLGFDYLGRLVELVNKDTGVACIRAADGTEPLPAFILDAYSANQAVYLRDPLLAESGGFVLAPPQLLFSTERSGDLERLAFEAWLPPRISVAQGADGQTLTCSHVLDGDIRVSFTVTLTAGDATTTWRLRIVNAGKDVLPRQQRRVYRALFPLLSRLCIGPRPEANWLARPYIQGELIPNPAQHDFVRPGRPGAHLNALTYPGWASMPWQDLYAAPVADAVREAAPPPAPVSVTGLYLASYDPTFNQVDLETVPDPANGTVAMGMRTLAFLEPGETWESQPFIVALHAGDWHRAADRYRADSAAWLGRRDTPAWVQDSDGWFGSGGPNYRYRDLPAMLEQAQWLGLNYLQCWSEMLENVGPGKTRKAYYCFFLPDPERGGERAMRAGVREVRRRGGHIGFYSNFWTWDADAGRCLEQWRAQIPDGIRLPYWSEFRNYMSVFPDGRMEAGSYTDGYAGACPGAAGWRDYLRFWIVDKYVKDYGVDAWYLDSYPVTMFGAARVCFSPHHGDPPGRPHGVGRPLLEFVRTLRQTSARTVKLAITSESVNDLFMRHNSHALGLELIEGITAFPKPEVYTYTFPHHPVFSGSCNGAGSGLKYYYPDVQGRGSRADTLDRVFLMGYRFDVLGYPLNRADPSTLYLRDLIALRQRIKGELYRSSFRDTDGLGPVPANVWPKVFRHDAGRSLTVAFLDRRADKTAFRLSVTPQELDVTGLSVAALYTLDGKETPLPLVPEAEGRIILDIPPRAGAPAAVVLRK